MKWPLLASFLLVTAACRTSSPELYKAPPDRFADSRFPTREALAALAQKPLPKPAPRPDPVSVAEWELAGPFPDRFAEALPATGAAGAFLDEVAPARGSEGLTCMARELGRFLLVNGRRPEPLLEKFMLGRCGNSVSSIAYYAFPGEAPETDDEPALFARVRADMEKWMKAAPDGVRLGIAALRGEGRKVIIVGIQGMPTTSIETTTQLAADGKVEVTGAVRGGRPLVAVAAQITKGALGVEKCTAQSAVLPNFAFTCPVGDDETASIAIAAWEKGRVLGKTIAQLTVLPQAGPGNVFKRVTYIEPTPMPPPEQLGASLIDAVNTLRSGAGLRPLTHAHAQDEVGARLSERYFAENAEAGAHDMIALGLMAGWEVKEITIGDGDFHAFTVYGDGLHDLIAGILAEPATRGQVMNADSNVASIAVTPIGKGYGVLLSTYEPLATPTTEMATDVFESLRAARLSRGLSDLMILPVEDAAKGAALRLHEGKDPGYALHVALREAAEHRGGALQGWVVQAQDLDRIDWPAELLTPQSTSVAISIGAYKGKNAAWGSLVMFVIAEIDDAKYALADR